MTREACPRPCPGSYGTELAGNTKRQFRPGGAASLPVQRPGYQAPVTPDGSQRFELVQGQEAVLLSGAASLPQEGYCSPTQLPHGVYDTQDEGY